MKHLKDWFSNPKHYFFLHFHQNRAEVVGGECGRPGHTHLTQADVAAGKQCKAGPWCAESGHHTD